MKIKALKLHDEHYGNQWAEEVYDRWDYDDFKKNESWRKGWISMDCSYYNRDDDRVYLGITSFDSDIFKAYDRKTGTFVDLGYGGMAHEFDAKFHRALEKGSDGCLYAAIALLHDVDNFNKAPGSPIVKYNPQTGDLSKLGIPLPHVYIQSIALDTKRDKIYGLCFAPEKLISYDMKTGVVKDYGLIGTGYCGMAQGENIVLDDNGAVWSNWMMTRAWQSESGVDAARLCKIDPETDEIVFYKKGLPRPNGSYGYAKAEAFFNLGDGSVYASAANGSLYRIDTETADAEYLFTPIPDRPSRLSSLVLGKDGCAYGVTGRENKCELLKFDFKNSQYELLGELVDDDGEPCWQVHHMSIADDGTLYACENDNPFRSSYLWEIKGF